MESAGDCQKMDCNAHGDIKIFPSLALPWALHAACAALADEHKSNPKLFAMSDSCCDELRRKSGLLGATMHRGQESIDVLACPAIAVACTIQPSSWPCGVVTSKFLTLHKGACLCICFERDH